MGKKMIYIMTLIIIIYFSYIIIIQPRLNFPGERIRVLMCGRSTMALWFKHWNWPYPLRLKTTYRPWPIPYDIYTRDNLYLEYLPLPDPLSHKPNEKYGQGMLSALEQRLDKSKYDAVFFKFCFVDFIVDENKKEYRFNEMTQIVAYVYNITAKKGLKLIVGNALPLPTPNKATLGLQNEYNEWLKKFATNHSNVLIFDQFTPLTTKEGRMDEKFMRSKDDPHPRDSAFSLLDKLFFPKIENWLRK